MTKERPVTTAEKLNAVQRRVNLQEDSFPRWVKRGHMTERQANRERTIWREILADYKEGVIA